MTKKQRKDRLKRINAQVKNTKPQLIFGLCAPCEQCKFYPRYCDRMSNVVEREIKLFGIVLYRKTKQMKSDYCSEGRHKPKYKVPEETYL